MNISYKWLKRYIDTDLAPSELAAVLTSLGLECDTVEEVETVRGGLKGLTIGKVLTCEPHPDSDHLHVTTVDVGSPEGPLQIVCGAPNVAAGQTVVVATIGTTLYDGDKEFKIKKSKMRGVESFGMICAEDEIGLGTDHAGIMVLEDGTAPGTPAAEYFKVDSDFRLEVELTPNRVDAAGHYGVARDLKAWLWREAYSRNPMSVLPEVSVPDVAAFQLDKEQGGVTVEVEDKEGCPRYSGVTIKGVKVDESPEWLKALLNAAGQRPINNIVDITNYILLGIGQPLHSFDLDKIQGGKIVVRTCPTGTKFTTLDGVEHTLDSSDLMICDAEKPMCIAGVFGGLDSGVTESTTSVFIESAYFNPTRVRRTARRHGLSTDASFRYERGTDPDINLYAARLAAIMIKEIAGGEICGPVIDEYPHPIERKELDFSFSYCNRLIGKEIPKELVMCILKALEFDVAPTADPDVVHLKVPAYRVDVYRPCDVVEEVLRVYGYNNVEFGEEMHATLSQRNATDESYAMQQTISEQLTANGFYEILNNSLTAASYYEDNADFTAEKCVKVINPLSQDLSLMRRTLLYGGLESISHNVNRKLRNLKFYEFGNIYEFNPEKESTSEHPLAPYSEGSELGIWMTGDFTPASWNTKAAESSVYDLKAIVLNIFRRLGVDSAQLKQTPGADDTFSARLDFETRAGKRVARLGILRQKLLRKFDIEQGVVFAAIDWNVLFKLASKNEVLYKPLPRTLPVERDLALLVDKSMDFATIEEAIKKAERKLLRDVRLFDVYEGKNLPEGKKSYAVSMTLQDDEKTLNDKQIEAVMAKIIKSVKAIGAELR